MNPIPCCPHCGGISGYTEQVTYRIERWTSWDGNDTDHVDHTLIKITKKRCANCGKVVNSS